MKLHLGCGQRYLDGYTNIDFPSSSHSVQQEKVADVEADILELSYPPQSVAEVRLHHVFEHFPRPVACALLCGWHSWLKPEGVLHIEVPDFERTARVMLSPFASFARKAVAERHLFGSHEAHWAVHCEGYTRQILQKMLDAFGFQPVRTARNSWLGTYNLEVVARKAKAGLDKDDLAQSARAFLRSYLLDEGDSESILLQVWMKTFDAQLAKCWAKNG